MMFSVVFRPQAEDEVAAARRWYEEHQPGLGARFADAVDDIVGRIGANPSGFPTVPGQIRRRRDAPISLRNLFSHAHANRGHYRGDARATTSLPVAIAPITRDIGDASLLRFELSERDRR